ncbi:MAG: hypothetical protein WCW52_03790 [Elusimicrobiales bacterium]|jgi:hypothetical protein
MGKWGILTLVVLGGLLLILKYFSYISARQTPQPAELGLEQPPGVALPPAATFYNELQPSGFHAPETYTELALPKEPAPYKGACRGGSLEEMRASHGKYWGFFTPDAAFNAPETDKMYDFVAGYVGCVALARDDMNLCASLPGETQRNNLKIGFKTAPNSRCRKRASLLLFRSYVAGNAGNREHCSAVLANWRRPPVFSGSEFCGIAVKGPRAAMEFLSGALPRKKEKLRKFMPASKAECGGDAGCIDNFQLYAAIRDGKISECPRSADRSLCEALISGSETPCEAIVRDMSRFYCAAVERVKKTTQGYIGLTLEEIKTAAARKTLEQAEQNRQRLEKDRLKKEEERQKEAGRKIQDAINKKVKAMLKRSGAGDSI